ncbi:uncharacterized protein AMSG_10192 [Thecamonas trahens ATCC 50062]|uniref:Uncharacterized protein n=1 Tax=Thecamonas trahens ATCC 50062 TaxID=461836 RepID=A0A0L0DRM7_THETB|nr:hypothetical protein AMSG_10192 [Thecamonas trahens ATCC 50062]KNC54950.1 hypothetical protein AMSG_10192 [Thecamonas trahens ATCC 50062]|eukprot:XP_013753400.1 hypothetical protein AMSG_10192 [Thecamonas trahens ATCC 50062]
MFGDDSSGASKLANALARGYISGSNEAVSAEAGALGPGTRVGFTWVPTSVANLPTPDTSCLSSRYQWDASRAVPEPYVAVMLVYSLTDPKSLASAIGVWAETARTMFADRSPDHVHFFLVANHDSSPTPVDLSGLTSAIAAELEPDSSPQTAADVGRRVLCRMMIGGDDGAGPSGSRGAAGVSVTRSPVGGDMPLDVALSAPKPRSAWLLARRLHEAGYNYHIESGQFSAFITAKLIRFVRKVAAVVSAFIADPTLPKPQLPTLRAPLPQVGSINLDSQASRTARPACYPGKLGYSDSVLAVLDQKFSRLADAELYLIEPDACGRESLPLYSPLAAGLYAPYFSRISLANDSDFRHVRAVEKAIATKSHRKKKLYNDAEMMAAVNDPPVPLEVNTLAVGPLPRAWADLSAGEASLLRLPRTLTAMPAFVTMDDLSKLRRAVSIFTLSQSWIHSFAKTVDSAVYNGTVAGEQFNNGTYITTFDHLLDPEVYPNPFRTYPWTERFALATSDVVVESTWPGEPPLAIRAHRVVLALRSAAFAAVVDREAMNASATTPREVSLQPDPACHHPFVVDTEAWTEAMAADRGFIVEYGTDGLATRIQVPLPARSLGTYIEWLYDPIMIQLKRGTIPFDGIYVLPLLEAAGVFHDTYARALFLRAYTHQEGNLARDKLSAALADKMYAHPEHACSFLAELLNRGSLSAPARLLRESNVVAPAERIALLRGDKRPTPMVQAVLAAVVIFPWPKYAAVPHLHTSDPRWGHPDVPVQS